MNTSTLEDADKLFAEGMLLTCEYKISQARRNFRRCASIRRQLLGRTQCTARAIQMHAETIRQSYKQKYRGLCRTLLLEAKGMMEEQEHVMRDELADVLHQLSEVSDGDFHDPLSEPSKLKRRALSLVTGASLDAPERVKRDTQRGVRYLHLHHSLWWVSSMYGKDSLRLANSYLKVADDVSSRAVLPEPAWLHVLVNLYGKALEILVRKLGLNHMDVAETRSKLAVVLQEISPYLAEEQSREVLRIAVLNHGIGSARAFQARRAIQSVSQRDTDEYSKLEQEIREHCPVKEELKAAAKWWGDRLRAKTVINKVGEPAVDRALSVTPTRVSAVPSELIDKFETNLEDGMFAEWSMDKTQYRVSSDYNPGKLLEGALTKSGIDSRFGLFPFKSQTIVEIGRVTAHTALASEVIFTR